MGSIFRTLLSCNTWSLGFWDSGKERHEASTTKEFSNKNGGISLSLRAMIYPLKTLSKNAILITALAKNTAAIATHSYNISKKYGEV